MNRAAPSRHLTGEAGQQRCHRTDRHPGLRTPRVPVRCMPARRSAAGFTLIEMLVAIALLAVVAVLSYRGLDAILRSREALTAHMSSERAMSQLFAQMSVDVRNAARDDELGQPPVRGGGGTLQTVRHLRLAGAPPRLQVVRYRDVDRRVV